MLGTMRRTYDMKDNFSSEEETGMEEFQREVLESSFLKAPTLFCFVLFCNGEKHTIYRSSNFYN